MNKNLKVGALLVCSAAFCSSFGQLAWKFGAQVEGLGSILWYLVGFIVAGAGAVLLMVSFRFGEVSILQPMMSISYVMSIILGVFFLQESVTLFKLIGTFAIVIGAILLGSQNPKEAKVGEGHE